MSPSTTFKWTWTTGAAVAAFVLLVMTAGALSLPIEHSAQAECAHYQDSQSSADNGENESLAPPVDCVGPGSAQETEKANHEQNSWPEYFIMLGTWALVGGTFFLGFFTFRLWAETRDALADARKTAAQQAADTAKAIAQATRSAAAMEGVAASMHANVQHVQESVDTSRRIAATQRKHGEMQMRAYLSVLIGGAVFQDANNNFEALPVIRNTGMTPARNVKWRMQADILPMPLPDDHKFPMPSARKGYSLIPPHSPDLTMNYVLPDRFPDADVQEIKRMRGRALTVWGVLSYDDVFGEHHRVTFCQQMRWIGPNDAVHGYYVSRHNKAQ